ncbi:thiolase C-terminal domain-containing protein [Natrinema gelatinilyticum]|uniref:thiolase C-terminal domain-containing protein n=1 Tax=Natrinema gelatinilyticum TaxID=2961571 RepID=UPI0020C39E62|nr:beta-ketoacyl synthase N-terminal-like domain-containing protein [Natrinema gelatinilyticum]
MRDAYIIGAGQTDFGSFPNRSYRSMFHEAFEATRESVESDVDPDDIEEAFVGMVGIGGRQIGLAGPGATSHLGLNGISTVRLENACASGGFAVRQAIQAIRSGMADLVLAGGVEMMNDMSSDAAKYWFGVSGEMEWERMAGTTFSGVFAQMASAHMEAHGTTKRHLSQIAVKSHAYGANNPHAQLGFECSLDQALTAPDVAAPLNLYHCCPMSDGAATVLIASEDVVDQYTDRPVRVAGVGASTDGIGLFERDTYTSIPASKDAAAEAYAEAGFEDPIEALDFAEVHDCFSIAELMAYEDLGFCEPGDGGEFIESGQPTPDGALPINTSGGLKSKGHPIGATGTGQVVEAFKQLTGRAGDRQIDAPKRGLCHNMGGSGGAVTVHVFERPDGEVSA